MVLSLCCVKKARTGGRPASSALKQCCTTSLKLGAAGGAVVWSLGYML